MKKLFSLLTALALCLGAGVFSASADVTPITEVFGTASDGTVLHWVVYTPTTPGPWPAVLIIHGGGFDANSPTSSPESVTCGQDLAAAGYIAFSVEYRLAPPGFLPGQVSDGRFPQQEDDVKLAVRTARADSRCNGQVGAIGGSAGGYHTAYLAATGTPGDDRIEVGVSLSGVFDASDFSPNPTLGYFTATVLNYFNNVSTTDVAALRAGSPAWIADNTIAPLFIVNSLEDPMPYSQLSDMIMHLDALGVTNYKVLGRAGSEHAFANWPFVKDQALTFLANGFAGVPPPPPLPTPGPGDATKKLVNVSTRADVGTEDDVMVGGFIITGTTNKRVVLRGLGPTLGTLGVSGFLSDPVLDLYDSKGILVESNDNRIDLGGIPNPLLPPNPSESLVTADLPPGTYTTVLRGAGNLTGNALCEVYDVEPSSSTVANISTRGQVTSGNDIIGGFIVGGTDATQVIVRALGPSLAAFGVQSALRDPYLELHDANGAMIAANDNWRSTQEQEIINTTIPPTDNKEAAIVATLNPGNYTAVVRDANFGSGVTLVEAYDLEPQ